MSLTNSALLVSLNISQWTGRKLDKTATNTVEVNHSTEKRVGNYTKKLLPGAKELDRISALAQSIRQFFYTNTLPWSTEGNRIISSKNYMDFTTEYKRRKNEFDQAVNDFIAVYPNLKAAAKSKLGNLFQEHEYPTPQYLVGAFKCEVAFYPLPDVSDFRVEISETEKQTFLATMRETETKAIKECWSRLYTVVEKAVEKLGQPEAIFRDSLIGNIQDLCSLIPKLNITDDPTLETMRQQLEKTIADVDVHECREMPDYRQEKTKELNRILDSMGAIMGAI